MMLLSMQDLPLPASSRTRVSEHDQVLAQKELGFNMLDFFKCQAGLTTLHSVNTLNRTSDLSTLKLPMPSKSAGWMALELQANKHS